MRLRSAAIQSTIALALILPAPAEANLLINGGFEDSVGITFNSGSFFVVLAAGSTALPGWVVTRATIDYDSAARYTNGLAASGDRSIDLDGTPGFGGIAQSFATAPGQPYLVTFAFAGNADGRFTASEPKVKHMRVLAAGASADFSFDTTGHTAASMGWITQRWTFTAVDAMTTLEFQSLDTAAGGYTGLYGPMIDDVGVVAVPEPSSAWLLLAGLLAARGARHLGVRRTGRRRLSTVFRGPPDPCETGA